MKKENPTCYMCEKPKVSKEHVPPQCLFPEVKDLGIDYRKNLITVPSCNDHNLKTSRDDEYLLGVIAFHWRNNEIASQQSLTKIKRALGYNQKFYNLFFGEGKNELIYWNDQALVTGTVDIERVNSTFDKIARGVYFDYFNKKWLGAIHILHFSLLPTYNQYHPILDEQKNINNLIRNHCIQQPQCGQNPDVFYYQIVQEPKGTITWIRMVFYGGFEIVAILADEPPGVNQV